MVAPILAINGRDLDATWIGDEETTLEDAATEVVGGKDAWTVYLKERFRGFPGGQVEVLSVVEGGSHVLVEFTGQGTDFGTYYGMAPPGRACLDRICNVYEIDSELAPDLPGPDEHARAAEADGSASARAGGSRGYGIRGLNNRGGMP